MLITTAENSSSKDSIANIESIDHNRRVLEHGILHLHEKVAGNIVLSRFPDWRCALTVWVARRGRE